MPKCWIVAGATMMAPSVSCLEAEPGGASQMDCVFEGDSVE
jgi:hypothetical protein